MMKLSSFKKVVFVAMALLVLPIALPMAGCGAKAGTVSVEPAQISEEMLRSILPKFAEASGLPEAAVPNLPPCMAVLAIPIKFTGSGWPADDIITIDLVIPADVEMTGLDRERGEDSMGIGLATADADGDFEAEVTVFGKINVLLRGAWLPIVAPDLTKLNPLPNGTYTLRAVGLDPEAVATATWELELAVPSAAAAEETAAEETALYENADYGFSVKYPADWAETTALSSPTLVFAAAASAKVPLVLVDVAEGATFIEALTAALEGGGSSDVKIKSESETTLADDTPASQAVIKFKNPIAPMAIDAFSLGVLKDGKWVVVTVATVGLLAKFDEAKFSEIAHTLQFE